MGVRPRSTVPANLWIQCIESQRNNTNDTFAEGVAGSPLAYVPYSLNVIHDSIYLPGPARSTNYLV